MKKFLIFFLLIIKITYSRETLVFTVPVKITRENEIYGVSFFRKVLDNLGYDLRLEVLPGERALQTANSGGSDGELARVEGIEKKYTNLIMIPERLGSVKYYIYGIKKYNFNSIEEIIESDETIINITGQKYIEKKLRAFINEERYEEVSKAEHGLRIVNYRKKGILIASEYLVRDTIKKEKLNNVLVSESPFEKMYLYPYLNIKNKNILEKIMNEMRRVKKQINYSK